MPELPEVENMKLSLLPYCNKVIKSTVVKNFQLREKINSSFMQDITNSAFLNIERLGKYLIFLLSNNKYLLMHAGMSGKFIINTNKKAFIPSKHTHIEFHLNDNITIGFNDPRRFGLALTFHTKEVILQKIKLGIDALSSELTLKYLNNLLAKTTMDIKTFLLNQNFVAGIGNIYACEILYHSKLHPLTKANTLNKTQIILLIKNIKTILNKAIQMGGSTLRDFKKPNGETGAFQNTFTVYKRNNQPCILCGALIQKIILNGRSTYFCPKEQHVLNTKT